MEVLVILCQYAQVKESLFLIVSKCLLLNVLENYAIDDAICR